MVAATSSIPVNLPQNLLADFCRRWNVRELALFGSAVEDRFGPASDLDVVVTFDTNARPTLLTLSGMQQELEEMTGRRVDLLERGGLEQSSNPYIRENILASLKVLYAG